ncbi:MAG: protein kinase [Candidatus Zixiibacteriota bacterium]
MLEAGRQFAHFNIIRLLGEGGMGQVYLAEDQKLGRQVALKVLTKQYFNDTERMQRFEREARTAAQVSHPNVMAIYDIGAAPDPDDGQEISYIVMEYISGKPLSDYMRAKPSDLATTVRLAEKIASGLAAAHKMMVVHRDIKADNIIVDDEDQPKILDFGLAKPMEPLQMKGDGDSTRTISKELTKAGKIVGTVSYMSPEQVRGEKVDARSDIFSFGILLYRMASGEFPFAGPTEVSTLAKILESKHEPLRMRNDSIPPELERIVDKCLQKDANDRYQDTRDLVVDLRNLRRQYDSGVTDSYSGMKTGPVAIIRRPKFYANWKYYLAAALLVFLAYRIFSSKSGGSGSGKLQAKENSLAILGFDNKTGDKSLDWMESGLPEILMTDLAETRSLNIISRQRILEAIDKSGDDEEEPTSEEYLRAARDLGATMALSGSYFKMGDKIRIDARLESIESGKILLGEKVVGTDPFSLVDSLTGKVAASLNISQGATEHGVASMTSSSPEAYKQYVLGMEKLGNMQWDEAIPYFNQAIAIDSTFALPYMRIGMSNALEGRSRQATEWFARATKFEGKLPTRERSMLDVYSDIWLKRKFDDAFTKLQVLVASYPDDVELRSIYAVLTYQLAHDTTKAFAQFDTALAQAPSYMFALHFQATVFLVYEQFDRVLERAKVIKGLHPDSWHGYSLTATVLERQGKYPQAIDELQTYLKRKPLSSDALFKLGDIYIRMRDFEKAQVYTDSLRVASGGDPFKLRDYYLRMENLAEWTGQFRRSIQYSKQSIDLMLAAKDSINIASAYSDLAGTYENIEEKDSALAYYRRAEQYSVGGMFPSLPISAVEFDPKNDSWARPIFNKWVTNFQAHTPKNLWGITDALVGIYEGSLKRDTAQIIKATRDLVKVQGEQPGSGNMKGLAQLLIANGQYQEGKKMLEGYISGTTITTGATSYIFGLYYLGRAYEGLGDKQGAKKYYQEVLKYWGKADVEVKQLAETRARLAKLGT